MNTPEMERVRDQRMEAVRAFAGRFGHDLNNALSPLLMSVGMLKSEEEDEQKRAMLTVMETSIHRASDMIRQILSFARGQEGMRGPLDLATLLRDLEKPLRETLSETIELTLDCPPNLPAIEGDSRQILELLQQLCLNAREAMSSGGTLRISATSLEVTTPLPSTLGAAVVPGNHVCISISDTGTGIRPEDALRLFEPYFSTKPKGKGKGLGLPTVLAILLGHQGFIRFSSVQGEGSTFEVYFPAFAESSQGPTG